ncbi:MAG: response regulator [Candidatus Omnitrophota bacterium]|jgi:CheY-like chemotaxis protein
MKILIADDEKEAVLLLKKYIERKNHDADVAYDGARALELIKENKYDIVFLDHNMPEITGLELIEYIKKNIPETKAVMITGYQQMADFAAKDLGADEYLTKPIEFKDIEKILDKYKNGDRDNGEEKNISS